MKAAVKAINEDNLEALKTAVESIEDINVPTSGKTLLYLAAEKESMEFSQVLLEKGADPNSLATTGMAPIHLVSGNTELFKLYLEKGGNYALPDSHQKQPIFYTINKSLVVIIST